ncbi:hypothetical protein D8L93_06200 [Sodalis-like symbiont of Bactericera trigonica]|nr:hypothetical protein D8L93_06200 [Sodalis-like symbiont of Bactericera trigonica]
MSDTTNPLIHPEKAAHESVLELIRAGKITNLSEIPKIFTPLIDYYGAELERIQQENKTQ